MILGLPEEEYFMPGHNACAGCGPAIAMRHIAKAVGPKSIIVGATGCMEVISTQYPLTAWKIPYIHVAFENAAAVASGVAEALKIQGREEKVIVISGDGGSYDIGFQALSGMIERGHDVLFITYDNEAYMNTGVQRSGATPIFANTTTSPIGKKIRGKQVFKKPLPLIVAAHGVSYVATASVSDPIDIYRKVKKALSKPGPKYIHILAPCQLGWKFPPDLTIEIAKLAVQTGIQPLYEIEDGTLKFTKLIEKRKPVKEYLKLQGRFKHLNEEEISIIQKHIDEQYNYLISLSKKGKVFP